MRAFCAQAAIVFIGNDQPIESVPSRGCLTKVNATARRLRHSQGIRLKGR
jgi:hypothetical protein